MSRITRRAAMSIPARAFALAALAPCVQAANTQVFTNASFRDKNGLFIENLGREEVQLFEDNEPRALEFLAGPEVPFASGIIFERSLVPEGLQDLRGLERGAAPATMLQNIAYELIDKILGKQALWVGAYDQELEILQDFTQEGFLAKSALQRIRGTSRIRDSFLYSALFSGATKMSGRPERRRILLAFLGHIDSMTISKAKALKNLLAASQVEVFLISSASRLAGRDNVIPAISDGALSDLATATAGDVVLAPPGLDHPEDAVRKLENHIRTLYTIGYESTGSPGKPAKLTIRCTRPGSKVKNHPLSPLVG